MCNDTTESPRTKVCSRCGQEKPATREYFYRSKNAPDGLAWQCKTCSQKQDKRRHQPDYVGPHQIIQELFDRGLAKCTDCQRILPIDEFYGDPGTKNGCKSWCKDCYAKNFGMKRTKQFPKPKNGYRYCIDCEQEKQLSNFYNDAHGKYGKSARCIDCHRIKHGITAHEVYPDGMKRCGRCHRLKPATIQYFNKGKAQYGLSAYCKDCLREWRVENREHIRKNGRRHVNKRRARLQNAPDDFSQTDWDRALKYFNDRCAVCGSPQGLWRIIAQDHWIPISANIDNHPGTTALNIIPLCHSVKDGEGGCNNTKSIKMPMDWLIETYGKRKAKRINAKIEAYFDWIREQDG